MDCFELLENVWKPLGLSFFFLSTFLTIYFFLLIIYLYDFFFYCRNFSFQPKETLVKIQVTEVISLFLPAGSSTYLLTASLPVCKQSFKPGPEHLKQINSSLCQQSQSHYCGTWTKAEKSKQIFVFCPFSPLSAVVMTRFTVPLPVGVFEDQPLVSIIDSSGAGGHTVRTISKVSTFHTLICTLPK